MRYIIHYEMPIKVNGRPIYKADQLSAEPVATAKNGPLEVYILKGLEAEMNKLPDGDYYLDLTKMVVATTGKVIYFENRGFKVIEANEDILLTPEFTEKIVPENIKNELDRKLDGLFAKAPLLKPGQLKGKNATSLSLMNFKDYKIVVKDHKATFSKR